MRTVFLASALALAATSAYASPSFSRAQSFADDGKAQKAEQADGVLGAAHKVIIFLMGGTKAKATPTPSLPDERPPTKKSTDCEEEQSASPDDRPTEKRKPAAPSELLFLAF
jgi:hypothetical protein